MIILQGQGLTVLVIRRVENKLGWGDPLKTSKKNCQVKNAKAWPPNSCQIFKIVKESYYFASTYQNI